MEIRRGQHQYNFHGYFVGISASDASFGLPRWLLPSPPSTWLMSPPSTPSCYVHCITRFYWSSSLCYAAKYCIAIQTSLDALTKANSLYTPSTCFYIIPWVDTSISEIRSCPSITRAGRPPWLMHLWYVMAQHENHCFRKQSKVHFLSQCFCRWLVHWSE